MMDLLSTGYLCVYLFDCQVCKFEISRGSRDTNRKDEECKAELDIREKRMALSHGEIAKNFPGISNNGLFETPNGHSIFIFLVLTKPKI